MAGELVGLYLRLSREDEGSLGSSESIQNQRELLASYAKAQGWVVVDSYADDGYSGTNFKRPAFLRLLHDIEARKINLVLTKDLSRLGRNYIETGQYLEVYFPAHRVRFIALSEGIDTAEPNSAALSMSPVTSVFNDFYARDISRKVRAALSVKRQRGEFIGASAPYGYCKNPENRHQLCIDAETAPLVRRIFQLYLGGLGLPSIAKQLTQEGILTPAQRKGLPQKEPRLLGVWNESILRSILKNPSYIGNLAQNRSSSISYKLRKRVRIPEEDWCVVEGTHAPIVDPAEFQAVQRLLQTRAFPTRPNSSSPKLLAGLLFCADCQAAMCASKSGKQLYWRCGTAKRHAGLSLCTTHSIRADYIEEQLRTSLRTLSADITPEVLLPLLAAHSRPPAASVQELALRQKLAKNEAVFLSLYRDQASGLLESAEYVRLQAALRLEHLGLSQALHALECPQTPQSATKQRQHLETVLRFETLSRPMLLQLIQRILVHEDKSLSIVFAFQKPI